jgi:putative ABC transport system substrate-binding protein
MCPAQDPIELGFVQSIARPGGNITGMTTATAELAGKNLELIREVLPAVRRVGIVGNAADPFHKPFLASIEAAARTLNFELKIVLSQGSDPFPATFAEVAGSGVQAMMVQPSLPRDRAAEFALRYRLPLFVASAEFAQAGALMAYGADNVAVYRQAATFVDKILKGRKPADLPVELATKFRLIVNLKTANALGLTLSPTLLNRADEVIE